MIFKDASPVTPHFPHKQRGVVHIQCGMRLYERSISRKGQEVKCFLFQHILGHTLVMCCQWLAVRHAERARDYSFSKVEEWGSAFVCVCEHVNIYVCARMCEKECMCSRVDDSGKVVSLLQFWPPSIYWELFHRLSRVSNHSVLAQIFNVCLNHPIYMDIHM